MALNFTVSYTFSPSTTISSSQVNTNTSDVAAVFQGLEAETKTLAKLKVDIDPTLALEVATKQYVDHYSTYRRPVLQFASVTTVSIESGLDGTSGDIPIQFPDGTLRTETSATRTTFNITRNAVLTTSGAQSGLTGATSEATNTWYALYAVKVTDSSTQWVTVGSTVLPLQANFSTLNTAYGTSGWVYLGLIRNGDGANTAGDILNFYQVGNMTMFRNTLSPTSFGIWNGIQLALSASTTALTYSWTNGTAGTAIPDNIVIGVVSGASNPGSISNVLLSDSARNFDMAAWYCAASPGNMATRIVSVVTGGFKVSFGGAGPAGIFLNGFYDSVLGVGSNPML